ncbi:von Willebrand factor D and EGF domain-containing protein-like [Ptychodera flava]|uniref:von Willebrand factor D and EGF domain-containing protein-like n=1 Tax=Ptychodera flava TaxID=63121 RepID=UPI00396AA062
MLAGRAEVNTLFTTLRSFADWRVSQCLLQHGRQKCIGKQTLNDVPTTIPSSAIEDPCYSHIEIDEPERSINYMADPSLPDVTYLCDDNLRGYQWYRFVSAAGGQMTTRNDLPEYACGTRYPLYMMGAHPTEINETTETSACNSRYNEPCFDKYDMEVKKCDGYYVYRLESVYCPSAYCAGTELVCRRHFVLLETLDTTDGNDEPYISRVDQFKHPIVGNEGFYSLGQNIRCSVTTYFFYAEVSSPEKSSGDFFAGITVHNRSVYIDENDDGPVSIEFSSSVPIECGNTVQPQNCKVEVSLRLDKTVKQENPKLDFKHCTVELGNDYEVNSMFSLEVVSQPTEPGDDSEEYIIEFSPNKHSSPSYFRDYQPEYVVVHRKGKKSGTCTSTGDPHYMTFDGRKYDWYGVGDYVMVREKPGKDGEKFNNLRFMFV